MEIIYRDRAYRHGLFPERSDHPADPLLITDVFTFRGFLLGSIIDFFLTFFILTIFRVFLITAYTFVVSSMTSRSKDKIFIFGYDKSYPSLLNEAFLRENSSPTRLKAFSVSELGSPCV